MTSLTKLGAYYRACNDLAEEFSRKYSDGDVHWIGGKIGEIANIGDLYMDMSKIADVMHNMPTVDNFYDAYWEHMKEDNKISFYNLIK